MFRARRLKDYKNRQHWQHQVDVRFECKIVKVDAGVVDGWRGIIEDFALRRCGCHKRDAWKLEASSCGTRPLSFLGVRLCHSDLLPG